MGDNEFVLHFEGDPNSAGGLSLKETADEIVAAIESGKRLRGELYSLNGGENRATMSDCTCFTLPAEGAVIITLSIGTLQWRGYSFAIDIGLSKAPDGTCLITDLSTARFENARWYDHMTT